MRYFVLLPAATISLAASALPAQPSAAPGTAAGRRPVVLSEADERDLALEALPTAVRAGAGVWVLDARGYRELRPATNGYTCIVNRDEVEAIKPTCYDEEGTRTILPVNVYFGEQLMQGVDVATIRERIAERYRSGEFRSPTRLGLAFMMSPRIVNVWRGADGHEMKGTAPPHYMIYAPHATNEQLALPATAYERHPWLPYIAYTGPAGFLIITLPDSAVDNAMRTRPAPGPRKRR